MHSLRSKLLMLVSIHRHGARSPEKFFNATWFPEGRKQLTPLGVHQMQNLGFFYRNRYFNQLSITNNPKTYPVYISSPLKRTLESAKNVYKGLFPNENPMEFNEIPVEINANWSWDTLQTAKNSTKNHGFPIFVQKEDSDFLFHGFKHNVCKKAAVQMEKKTSSDEAMKKLSELRKTLFPILSESLKKGMGIELDPQKMSFSNMKGIYDVLVSTKAHEVKVDFGLSQENFKKLAKERRDFIFNYKLGDPNVIQLSTNVFLSLLRNFFQEKKRIFSSEIHKNGNNLLKNHENGDNYKQTSLINSNLTQNMVLFSGHDTVINLILNALLNKQEKEELGELLDIQYGSHLDFELFEENGYFYVQTYLNEKILNISNCNKGIAGKCKLEDFDSFLKARLLENLEEECGNISM